MAEAPAASRGMQLHHSFQAREHVKPLAQVALRDLPAPGRERLGNRSVFLLVAERLVRLTEYRTKRMARGDKFPAIGLPIPVNG
jgi:hypothetical protein